MILLKVWWPDATVFHQFFFHTAGPPWVAEPRFELGLALQQAGAPPFELRRTRSELRHTLSATPYHLSYAALSELRPTLSATPHHLSYAPPSQQCRTI
jgi:hypothetical protein